MFIEVRLLKGYTKPLLYEVPVILQPNINVGSIVRVPIQKRFERAVTITVHQEKPLVSFTIKSITHIEPFPYDQHYLRFISQLATYYQTDQLHYIKRMQHSIVQKPLQSSCEEAQDDLKQQKSTIELTTEQQEIVDALQQQLIIPQFAPNLIHGVTGSGKTEIYKQLLHQTYMLGKTAVLLLPEVTLALQFEQLLKQQMDTHIQIHSFHCASSVKDKKIIWHRLLHNQPTVIIGVHMPILLPLPNLGLIIVDEEHEVGYQEKKHPKTNSKEAALIRAKLHNIPIVLGSATPSISSLYNVEKKGWNYFQLKKRFGGTFPDIKIVQLNDHLQRHSFWISKELQQEMRNKLACNEQTILFLNRRGHSFFVQCKQCSFTFSCNNCSVSLTLHDTQQLICHYCGFSMTLPNKCSGCQADEKQLLKKGVGTQQLMQIVQKMFPSARIARADLDTTTKKNEWKETVTAFYQRKIDILIGTQTITKGYHFPHVTLIGIIWADINLHFPRYNATEITLQQLIQVAGRAGRATNKSLVIVQTIADHQVFNYLQETEYLQFFQEEIAMRKEVGYPPITRLVEIEVKHAKELVIEQEIKQLAQLFIQKIQTLYKEVKLLGPAKPPVHKIKNSHTRVLFLKHPDIRHLQQLYQSIDKTTFKSSIFFTPNPQ